MVKEREGAEEQEEGKIIGVNDFLFATGTDNINFFLLSQYIHNSNIIHKVRKYTCFFSFCVVHGGVFVGVFVVWNLIFYVVAWLYGKT